MVDLVRDVEAPTVDVGLADPLFADADEVLPQLGVRCVQLRVAARAVGEGLVVDRIEVDRKALQTEEPIAVFARLAFLEDVLEREPAVTRVVEDTIEKHADVAAVSVADERGELVVRAQSRVDVLVVGRVVLVVGGRREDRSQVQAGDSQIGEPVEVLTDSRQVPAEEGLHRRRFAPWTLPCRIVHLIAVREAIGENEVEGPSSNPSRHRETVDGKVVRVEEMAGVMLALRAPLVETVLVEEAGLARAVGELEEVSKARGRHR